jgi:alginate O-acetyltransferase complex protein AlgI
VDEWAARLQVFPQSSSSKEAAMLFLTYWFVLFICVLYPIYWLFPLRRVRLAVLLVACAIFHTHFAGPAGVLPIIALALFTYLAGLTRNRHLCRLAILANVLALLFYKYMKFLCLEVIGGFHPHWKAYLLEHHAKLMTQAPPLAISFFVFEFVHYLVDVGRGSPSIKNPLHFSLYSIFWPSIVAGPVKRYQDFLQACQHGLEQTTSLDVAIGLVRLAIGLVKKFVADILTAWLAFYGPQFAMLDPLWRWAFVFCLGFRILLDFSGYSDMAIGFARMHGIVLMENFRWPYLAQNLSNFWTRWHISLSTWIRDYVYIPLGGGRCGPMRKSLNGLTAFALCGLWHGAGWNFLVWGLYHGVGLALCSSYKVLFPTAGPALAARFERHPQLAWLLTVVYAMVGWLFFFYPIKDAFKMLNLLFQGH